MKEQPLHIGVQQRVLPAYRIPFFDKLAESYLGKVSVFYGLPRSHEMLETNTVPQIALHVRGRNLHLFSGQFYLCWQFGFMQWLQSWQPDVLIMEANPRYLKLTVRNSLDESPSPKSDRVGAGFSPFTRFFRKNCA